MHEVHEQQVNYISAVVDVLDTPCIMARFCQYQLSSATLVCDWYYVGIVCMHLFSKEKVHVWVGTSQRLTEVVVYSGFYCQQKGLFGEQFPVVCEHLHSTSVHFQY